MRYMLRCYGWNGASFSLRMRRNIVYGKPAQRPAQLQQIDCSKRRAAGSYQSELVRGLNVGPSGSDPAKSTSLVRINDPILTPMSASADQFNLATVKGMKGVGETNLLGRGRSHTSCI